MKNTYYISMIFIIILLTLISCKSDTSETVSNSALTNIKFPVICLDSVTIDLPDNYFNDANYVVKYHLGVKNQNKYTSARLYLKDNKSNSTFKLYSKDTSNFIFLKPIEINDIILLPPAMKSSFDMCYWMEADKILPAEMIKYVTLELNERNLLYTNPNNEALNNKDFIIKSETKLLDIPSQYVFFNSDFNLILNYVTIKSKNTNKDE